MSWLSFVVLALALYLPPLNLAQYLWQWAARQHWMVPLFRWHWPAWLAYAFWLAAAYLSLAAALHFIHHRLPSDSRLGRLALRVLHADLGALGVLVPVTALAVLLLAWPILPAARVMYGWRGAISVPVACLAAIGLLAETLRLTEGHFWDDRAFEAQRTQWLIEHGHYR